MAQSSPLTLLVLAAIDLVPITLLASLVIIAHLNLLALSPRPIILALLSSNAILFALGMAVRVSPSLFLHFDLQTANIPTLGLPIHAVGSHTRCAAVLGIVQRARGHAMQAVVHAAGCVHVHISPSTSFGMQHRNPWRATLNMLHARCHCRHFCLGGGASRLDSDGKRRVIFTRNHREVVIEAQHPSIREAAALPACRCRDVTFNLLDGQFAERSRDMHLRKHALPNFLLRCRRLCSFFCTRLCRSLGSLDSQLLVNTERRR
mmetsp:Transcript_23529/g.38840  ORF Transcript_23529/g.38840 Transcript_23529/m.38840 type:complete len:262 (+) Transcript_23529:199-984(+)